MQFNEWFETVKEDYEKALDITHVEFKELITSIVNKHHNAKSWNGKKRVIEAIIRGYKLGMHRKMSPGSMEELITAIACCDITNWKNNSVPDRSYLQGKNRHNFTAAAYALTDQEIGLCFNKNILRIGRISEACLFHHSTPKDDPRVIN